MRLFVLSERKLPLGGERGGLGVEGVMQLVVSTDFETPGVLSFNATGRR